MSASKSISSSDYLKYLHKHDLMKNDDYDAREGDLCHGCGLLLYKKSAVYHCTYSSTSPQEDDCAQFFLHQSCSHLPWRTQHPSHQKHSLYLITQHDNSNSICRNCSIKLKWFFYCCYNCEFQICLACVVPLKDFNIDPPYHGHKLTLSTRLASFECDACQKVDTDFSYMCYTCPFWIHLSCSNIPNLLECKTRHKHPLRLAYSLPENYLTFRQSCKICTEQVYPTDWLYYCPNCRFLFFAHIKCAISPPTSRIDNFDFDELNFLHLPLPENESLLQKFFKETNSWSEDACVTPPDQFYHWSHEHQLVLKNKSVLSAGNEERMLPICNGCTESISTNDFVCYECNECDYILHKYCAMLPKEIQLDLGCKHIGVQPSVQDIWSCTRCEGFRNGTQLCSTYETNVKLDSGCAVLPTRIKHESHSHLLELGVASLVYDECLACNKSTLGSEALFKCTYNNEGCNYCIHTKCALKPGRVTHRWDPHSLYLIFSPEDVTDHPHEFHCELCSEEINTNYWFYHCSVCDLSFHFNECLDMFFRYSKVKFGATNIKIEAHQHGLTFVLNKKKGQPCLRCHSDTYNKPVLVCTPCKFIQHANPDLCS